MKAIFFLNRNGNTQKARRYFRFNKEKHPVIYFYKLYPYNNVCPAFKMIIKDL